MARLENVLAQIDAFNSKDPRGIETPYSERLTRWVLKLNPSPSEPLRIAARGQHMGRWIIPRSIYPMDRGGYLRWREELKRFHAKTVGEIMAREGYADGEIDAVKQIILKKNFQANPDAQTIEDALCLVFLESQFEELRQFRKHFIPRARRTRCLGRNGCWLGDRLFLDALPSKSNFVQRLNPEFAQFPALPRLPQQRTIQVSLIM